MVYIRVFFLGGLLCVAFQLLRMFLGTVHPPHLNVLGFALGGIMTPFGLAEALNAWGDWGFGVTVIAGGHASAKAFYALLKGNFLPILETLGIYIAIGIIGLSAGYIRSRIESGVSGNDSR